MTIGFCFVSVPGITIQSNCSQHPTIDYSIQQQQQYSPPSSESSAKPVMKIDTSSSSSSSKPATTPSTTTHASEKTDQPSTKVSKPINVSQQSSTATRAVSYSLKQQHQQPQQKQLKSLRAEVKWIKNSKLPKIARLYTTVEVKLACRLCKTEEVATLFLPCRHVVCCARCTDHINVCPCCEHQIVGSVKIYFE